jgi:GT2 family glycosyltransferase
MSQVSVVIINWNGKHLLERCLPSVLGQVHVDIEVVILDNGSTDGSVEWVKTQFPLVRVMCSDRNLGFARGNNEAIRATESRYVATLNNDTEPDPDWLSELVEAMDSSPTVGMCASKMVRADDTGVMDSCGIRIDRGGIGWNRYAGERDHIAEDTPYEVLGPCAGAALYRRAMLDQVGLFDESYFIYYEDVDLAWRAQRLGWRCLYVPSARVVHRHSSTVREGSSLKGFLLGRNKVWTLVKNYPWPDWLLCSPLIVGYDTAAWLYALMRGDPNPLRGRMAAVRSLAGSLAQRRAIQSAGKRVRLSPSSNPWRMWRTQREFRQKTLASSEGN